MSVVRFEVLFVVADGALVDQPVLRAGEVRRSVPRGKVERKTTCLAGDYAFRVTFGSFENPTTGEVLRDFGNEIKQHETKRDD